MEEGKRQKQVAGAIQATMNDIFLNKKLNTLAVKIMVIICNIKIAKGSVTLCENTSLKSNHEF